MAENTPIAIDEKLLHATVKLNTLLFAGVGGLMGGLALFSLTCLSLLGGVPSPGYFLNLLGVFLPGYSVSPGGAWVGLAWGAALGAFSSAAIYRIYARSIRQQVADYMAGDISEQAIEYAVLKVHGHSIGLALGSIAALGLLVTTNWLVVRGTAGESIHAQLLSHYLPGYTVSASGSVVGAMDIFVITYLLCALLGAIYNRLVRFRQQGAAS